MKKHFALMSLLFLIFSSLVACGKSNTRVSNPSGLEDMEISSPEEMTSVEPKGSYTFGVSFANRERINENNLLSAIEENAAKKEINLDIQVANNNYDRQVDQIKKFVQDKVAAIIIEVVDDTRTEELLAIAGDTPLVFVGRSPNATLTANKMTYVGVDDLSTARLQSEFLIEFFKAQDQTNPKIVLMDGDNVSHFTKACNAELEKSLQDADLDVEIVFNGVGNWEEESAKDVFADFLDTNVDFDVVVAQNDEMALGVITALEEADKNPLITPVLGADGIENAALAIGDSKMAFSIYKNTDIIGQAAIDAGIILANGEEAINVFIDVPGEPISSSNYETFIK